MASPPTRVTAQKSPRARELNAFLRSRRARVTPAEAGLPGGGARRRTPGLRREEVAVLAGVGASWYQWLEQGRDITVSPHVLDAVAHVLRLSGTERRHLYVLAGLNPPLPESEYPGDHLCGSMRRLLDSWLPYPAQILDAYWNSLALNEPARLALGVKEGDNCVLAFFFEERFRTASWERNAPVVVGQLRSSLAEHPEDEGSRVLVAELTERSEDFRRLWAQVEVAPSGLLHKELAHPVVGTLHFESTTLQVPVRPDLRLVLHNPVPHTGTAEKLERLTEPGVRRATMHEVAG